MQHSSTFSLVDRLPNSWFLDLKTGRQGFAFLGKVDHFAGDNLKTDRLTPVNVSGQGLEIALNSITAGASAEVSPTGIELTIGLGSINVQSWQIVNTGSDVNWNIIDTAA